MDSLRALGWNEDFEVALAAISGGRDYTPARVSWQSRGQVGLLTPNPIVGVVAGRLEFNARDARDLPCVGDWVLARVVGDTGLIEHVLERRSLLVRKAAGRSSDVQPIAANIDRVLIVTACGGDLSVRRVERYLAAVLDAGADPVVVLNKTDLVTDPAPALEAVRAVAGAWPVVGISALGCEGVDALHDLLEPATTACLVGSSGVGKSTLINALLGESRQRTREVRESDERGQHTTVRREMFPLRDGALLIDTPGMRELQPWTTSDGVESTFEEIELLAEQCRYRNCTHEDVPGCAVLDAIEAGTLDPSRLASYQKLLREQAWLARRRDRAATSDAKKRWKDITKAMRQRRKVDPKLQED